MKNDPFHGQTNWESHIPGGSCTLDSLLQKNQWETRPSALGNTSAGYCYVFHVGLSTECSMTTFPGCLVTEDSLFSQCSWSYLFISIKHHQQMVDFIWPCFTHFFLPNDVCVQLYWLIRLVFQVSTFLQVTGNRLLIAWGEMKNGHLLCSRNTPLLLQPSLPAVFLS